MIYAAFMMGLLGSLHCLGMCGPIAFALPVRTNNIWLKVVKYLLYNAGRVSTYVLLGLVIGMVGKGFALIGLQQILSIITGILIILSVILIHNPFPVLSEFSHIIKEKLKSAFQFHFKKVHVYSLFILGLLNGLLPCGMVYAAMAGALTMGNAGEGALFMAVFGMGTVPLMMGIALSKNWMGIRMKMLFNRVTPYIACILGLLLIMRGLNLDIPFISPFVSQGKIHSCH